MENIAQLYIFDIQREKAITLQRTWLPTYKKKKAHISSVRREDLKKLLPCVDLLINATPCGMLCAAYPYPLDKSLLSLLSNDCTVVEMVYNPLKTPLISFAKKRGNPVIPGNEMLVEQAAISFELAFGALKASDKALMHESIRRFIL